VARGVYKWMLKDGVLNILSSAEGLHREVRALRERTREVKGFTKKVPSDPLVWASYIHIGV
jgi:hypothetical protein